MIRESHEMMMRLASGPAGLYPNVKDQDRASALQALNGHVSALTQADAHLHGAELGANA